MRYRVFCECRMGILYLLYIFTNDYTIGHASTTLRLLYYIYDNAMPLHEPSAAYSLKPGKHGGYRIYNSRNYLRHAAICKNLYLTILSTIVEII